MAWRQSRYFCFRWLLIAVVVCTISGSGCATIRSQPKLTQISNPLFVRGGDFESVWEKSVDVIHAYLFETERENKLNGVIETRYKTGASLIEPWHHDSVTLNDRLESTLQSIRRKIFVSVTPTQGGFFVGVESLKELEDAPGAPTSPGVATFGENDVLSRDVNSVVGTQRASAWIPRGRDYELEQAMLKSLQVELSR